MSRKTKSAFPDADRGPGLTKREYAAIHILAGMMASDEGQVGVSDASVKEAVSGADLLFAQLRDGGSTDADAPGAVPE